MFKGRIVLLLLNFLLFYGILDAQNCTVNAGIPESICDNETMQLSGNSDGLFTSAASWTQVGGPSVAIVNPASLNTTINGYLGGQNYTFRISATCQDGVTVYDEVTITVSPVTSALAGADQQSCPGTGAINLNANTPGTDETGEWSIVSNGAGISGLDVANPGSSLDLPQSIAGTSILRWTFSHTNGCETTDEVSITNLGGILPVAAGDDQNLSNCYSTTQTASLNASFGGNGTGGQQGTWSLVSGPNYPTFDDVHNNLTNVSNLVEGVYVFRWEVAGPCVNGSDEVTITVPGATQSVTTATAANLRFCHGATTAVLEGSSAQFANEVVTWTQLFGPGGVTISNPNSPTTSITGLDGSSTYRFGYTITNSATGCLSVNNSVYIRFAAAPTMDAGPDKVLDCGVSTVTVSPTVTGGTNTRYKIINGPITTNWIANNNANIVINNLNEAGNYTMQFERYSVGTGCTSAFDVINVSVSVPPTLSNAGTDQILACAVVETDLAGNAPSEGVGNWSQVSGPNTALIANPLEESSHISNLIEGEYVFRWVIAGGNNCPVQQDEVTVVVSEYTPAVAAGSDRSVCHSTEVKLEGNTPKPGALGTWSVTPDAGLTFSDIQDPSSSVFGMQANTAYTFTWTISNQCQVESADVVITSGSTAGPSPAFAGPDQCESTGAITLTMDGNDPAVGDGLWTILSGPNNPTITDNTSPTTSVTDMIDGNYLIEWSINVPGCISTRDTLIASILSNVTIANAGDDVSVCGSSVVLAANTPGIDEIGHWEQISGNSGFNISDVNAHDATFSDMSPGRYEFSWIIEKGVCPSSSDDLIITVSEQPDVAVTSSDYTVCGSTNAILSANNPIAGVGVWSIIGEVTSFPNIFSITDPTTTVSALATGSYQFRWTITTGSACTEAYDDVTIQVSAPAVAEPDRDLCNITETLLEGTKGSDGTWSVSPANTGLPLPIINNTNIHTAYVSDMALDQTYTFRYTVAEIYGCPETFDDLTVSTSSYGTTPDAGPDQEVCLSGGNSTIMNANTPTLGSGQWTQLSGPGTATIDNINAPGSHISGLIAGVYVFQWNVDYNHCGNYSDAVRVTVNEPPTSSDAGSDQINACQLDAQLSANLPVVGVGVWSLVSAPTVSAATAVVINNPALPNTTISNITDLGAYEFMWTTSNGNVCALSSSNVTITFSGAPPTTPNASDDQNFCNANSFVMNGNEPISGTGTWTQISGPAGASITNPNSFNTDVTNVAAGTYEFQWTIESSGCTLSDNVIIVNNVAPLADASATDPNICQSDIPLLIGNTPIPGNGSWSFVTGPTSPVISSPSSQNSNVTGAIAGSYTFKWTITNGICPSSEDEVTIQIGEAPMVDLNVTGDEVCNGNDASVGIVSSENNVNYTLLSAGNAVGSAIGNGADILIPVSNEELNVGTNSISIFADNQGCNQMLNNQATINVLATPNDALNVTGSSLCGLKDGNITIGSSETGINYVAFIGTKSVASYTGDGNNLVMNVLATDLNIGTNTIQVVATNPASSCFVNMTDQAIITIIKPSDINIGVSGSTICNGNNGVLNIPNSLAGANYDVFIGSKAVSTAIGTGTSLNIEVEAADLAVGNNVVDVFTNTTANCVNINDNRGIIVVNANPQSDLTINNTEICNGDIATITIEKSEANVNYLLFIKDELVANGQGNGSILDIDVPADSYTVGKNEVKVMATNSLTTCSLEMDSQPEIDVEPCKIIVFNGFSPNGDGINETFIIEGLDNYPNHKMTILNRWGNKVYEASPYLNDWDGTSNMGVTVGGNKLPVGTYFYIIEPGNGEKPIKGYIYLNK